MAKKVVQTLLSRAGLEKLFWIVNKNSIIAALALINKVR